MQFSVGRDWSTIWSAKRWETGLHRATVDLGVMQCLVYAVLGAWTTQGWLEIMACSDSEEWLEFVFLGDGWVVDNKEIDERRSVVMGINWDLGECHIWVNVPCPIWQVWLLIQQVITRIYGVTHPIRQVRPGISPIHSYAPYCSHFLPPSSQNTKLSHLSQYLHSMNRS